MRKERMTEEEYTETKQEIERIKAEIERLRKEKNKLIDKVRWYEYTEDKLSTEYKNGFSYQHFGKRKKNLTEKEKKTILHYAEECGAIELPMNHRYCYSMTDYIDIADNWEYQLDCYSGYKNINVEALKKFETLVKGIFETLCSNYEKYGYEYFYEISEEDLKEICYANGYEFLESGKIFY